MRSSVLLSGAADVQPCRCCQVFTFNVPLSRLAGAAAEALAALNKEINNIGVAVVAVGDAVLAEERSRLHKQVAAFGALDGCGELLG